MGSFNDLVVHPLNGHRVSDRDVRAVNQRFDLLRSRAYDLAFALAHIPESK